MLRGLAISVLIFVLGAGCARRNLDTICQLAKDILSEPRTGPDERLERFRSQVGHFASGIAQEAADAALAAPPSKRFDAFMSVADGAVSGWTCAALEPVLEPPVVP